MSKMQGGRTSPALDCLTSLRFFAAVAVVFYHSGSGFAANSGYAPKFLQNVLENGWLGVPFFFILSGFILTYAHADLHFDRLQLKRFFAARFARLYPVYLFALALSIPFVDHYSFSTDWFQFFLLQSWFPGSGATDWNFVAWTLSVELFFYLVFPFAFALLRRLPDVALLGGLCVTIAFLLAIWLNMTPSLGEGELRISGILLHIPLPLLRLPEFIYGMLLGVLFLRRVFRLSSAVAYAAALVILVASSHSTHPATTTTALIALGALIISLAAAPEGSFFRNILEKRTLLTLGGASYAFYLLQYPIRKYMAAWIPDHYSLWARWTFAPVLAFMSILVFLYFEGPMRKMLRHALEPSAVPSPGPQP